MNEKNKRLFYDHIDLEHHGRVEYWTGFTIGSITMFCAIGIIFGLIGYVYL